MLHLRTSPGTHSRSCLYPTDLSTEVLSCARKRHSGLGGRMADRKAWIGPSSGLDGNTWLLCSDADFEAGGLGSPWLRPGQGLGCHGKGLDEIQCRGGARDVVEGVSGGT